MPVTYAHAALLPRLCRDSSPGAACFTHLIHKMCGQQFLKCNYCFMECPVSLSQVHDLGVAQRPTIRHCLLFAWSCLPYPACC